MLPLAHRRILVTRAPAQASALAAQLEAQGAEVVLIPTIELAPPASWCALDAALASLRSFDWLLFTSANGVHAFAGRARQLGLSPHAKRIAAIGPATAAAVRLSGLAAEVDLMPTKFVAESFAELLRPHATGANMLLVRASSARDVLPESLLAAGASLTIAEAYRTVVPDESVEALRRLFAASRHVVDAITFTSASTATNLAALLESAALVLPPGIILASIGPITSEAMRQAGFHPTVEARASTIPALVEALVERFTG